MATIRTMPVKQNGPGRSQVQDVDRHVGARLRERRIMQGLTQQQMGELIGVAYQQVHKYEKGINRIAAGWLYNASQVLDVEVSFFFEGMDSDNDFEPTPQQRRMLDLARNFISMPSREHRETICNLARLLASGEDLTVASAASRGDESEDK